MQVRRALRRIARRAFVVVVAALLVVPTISAVGIAADERAVVDLHINTEMRRPVFAYLRESDVLLSMRDVREAGLVRVGGVREQLGGEEFVSLLSLAPAVRFTLDRVAVVLDLTVDPKSLTASVLDGEAATETSVVTRAHSGFFNYAYDSREVGAHALSGELGLSLGAGILTTGAASGGPQAGGRLRTSWTYDDLRHTQRLVVGDVFASNTDLGGLGGSASLFGVSFGREASIDTLGIRRQLGKLSGTVETPTTAELYVNGVLIRQQVIPPGPFTFVNFPLQAGSNDTVLVLRDSFGRERRYNSVLFSASNLLARGARDYAVALGRPTADNPDGTAGGFSLLGHYRYGLADNISVGAAIEHSKVVSNLSTSIDFVNRLGQFDFEIAGSEGITHPGYVGIGSTTTFSEASAVEGAAASVASPIGRKLFGTGEAFAWTLPGRNISFAAQIGFRSPSYANLSTAVGDDRAIREANAAIGFSIGASKVTVNYRNSIYRDAQRSAEFTVSDAIPLGRRLGAISFAAGMRRVSGNLAPVFRIEYFANRGGNQIAARSNSEQGHTTRTMEISKPVTPGVPGLGYRISSLAADGASNYQSELDYQGEHVNVAALGNISGGRLDPGIRVAGAVAFVDGTFAFTRPIQSSFALLDVDGIPGVRADINGRPLGATNRKGRLMVTDLAEYRQNRFKVDGTDAPADYLIESDVESAVPMHLGGVHVHFPGHRIVAFTGSIDVREAGGVIAPDDGRLTLTLGDSVIKVDLGTHGRFYFENVTPGEYDAKLDYGGGTCRFKFDLKKPVSAVTQLGTVHCLDNVPTTRGDYSSLTQGKIASSHGTP